MQAFEVDEQFAGLVLRGQTLAVQYRGTEKPPERGQTDAMIDLETGRVNPVESTPPSETDEALLAWLREACDETTLNELRRRWSVFKDERKKEEEAFARKTWKDQDWTVWDGEERVGWFERRSNCRWGRDVRALGTSSGRREAREAEAKGRRT